MNKLKPIQLSNQLCIDSGQRVGLGCQKRGLRVKNLSPLLPFRNDSDRTGLCSKRPDTRLSAWRNWVTKPNEISPEDTRRSLD